MTTAPPGNRTDRLPAWRIGANGGLVGVLCCVGPDGWMLERQDVLGRLIRA